MKDLTGLIFGKWAVLGFSHRDDTSYYWLCRCECGKQKMVNRCHLTRGKSTNCGCLKGERLRAIRFKHGQSICDNGGPSGTYESWQGAKDRCFNKKDKRYPDWGGRGISMCLEWKNSFEAFFAHMGRRPDGLTLDRINNNGNYEPGNCRWADHKTQSSNQRKRKPR